MATEKQKMGLSQIIKVSKKAFLWIRAISAISLAILTLLIVLSMTFYEIYELITEREFFETEGEFGIIFIIYMFLVPITVSIVLLLSWNINFPTYRKFLRVMCFAISSTATAFGAIFIVILLTLSHLLLQEFSLYQWEIVLQALLFWVSLIIAPFFPYVISLYILSQKDWYPNTLLLSGFMLTLLSIIFVALTLYPTYTKDNGINIHEHLSDISLMLIPLLYPLLLMALGYIKKEGIPGQRIKFSEYEITAIVMLFLFYLTIGGFLIGSLAQFI